MGSAPRVLVIDDSALFLKAILGILARAGFQAAGAASALEGVGLARREPPDLILAEVLLPDQDGATTVSCLRELPGFEEVPFILISGLPEEELRGRMADCGAVDMLHKPFSPACAVERIRHWIDLRRAVRPAG